MKIFILENRYHYLGDGEKVIDSLLGESIIIKNCYNITTWGTEKYIGQLCLTGKQPNTVLNYVGIITVPISKIIHILEVLPEAAKTLH